MEQVFYDGAKLLSQKDLNGNTPEIFLCTTNRSAGKTTYFGRLMVNRFKDSGDKFGLIYRYKYELDDCANKFFKDIKSLFFPNDEMYSKAQGQGSYHLLYLNDKPCGYAFALNSADQIKKYSHLFSDVKRMLMDEFQSETNHYCPNEISKFLSIHTSLARGNGEQVKYLPVIMISNAVTLINPYYLAMGISDRLQSDTNYLKGDGYVLEQGFYESVADAQLNSAFNRAFKDEKYVAYASQNIYLNDNACLIERPSGRGNYLCTIKADDKFYSLKRFDDAGVYYIDNSYDETCPRKIVISAKEQDAGYVYVGTGSIYIATVKKVFEQGKLRFKNQQCKAVAFQMMRYNLYE